MENQKENEEKKITEPKVLTANTFYWDSCDNASKRRWRESKYLDEVESYFNSIGITTSRTNERVIGTHEDVEIKFFYSESAQNVYKRLSITRDGKRSNITTLRNIAKKFTGAN